MMGPCRLYWAGGLMRWANIILMAGLVAARVSPAQGQAKQPHMSFQLSSSAFASGVVIPREYTCDGADESPDLHWADPPPGTATFALVIHDPDAPAGDWVHWVAWNIPKTSHGVAGNFPRDEHSRTALARGETTSARLAITGRVLLQARRIAIFFVSTRLTPSSIWRPESFAANSIRR